MENETDQEGISDEFKRVVDEMIKKEFKPKQKGLYELIKEICEEDEEVKKWINL